MQKIALTHICIEDVPVTCVFIIMLKNSCSIACSASS